MAHIAAPPCSGAEGLVVMVKKRKKKAKRERKKKTNPCHSTFISLQIYLYHVLEN